MLGQRFRWLLVGRARELTPEARENLLRELNDATTRMTKPVSRPELFGYIPAPGDDHVPLRFSGLNAQKVPVYTGSREAHTQTEGWLMAMLLLCAVILFYCGNAVISALCAVIAVIVYVVATVRRIWRMRLSSIADLSERNSVPELTFLLVARERGIEPNCIINGREYYDSSAFGDPQLLLRPADGPGAESLLLPAAASTTDEETLLRTTTDV